MEEMLDVFDKNGRWLGVKSRSFCHGENPGVYHKAVWLWLINDNGEVLVQKRAKCKKKNPEKWDISVAGHVAAGETCLSTLSRETKEELGIDLNDDAFLFKGELVNNKGWSLEQIYVAVANFDIRNVILQKKEVEQVKWLSFDDFVKLLYSEDFVPHTKSYKNYFCKILKDEIKK